MMLYLSANGFALAAGGSGTHVYLLRGIFNVSVGLDALAGKLARIGIAASVYGYDEEGFVAAEAIRGFQSGRVRSVVLIGHSLGAMAVISVARQLNHAGVPVALLISLDPIASGAVPPNVARAVNYYISAGRGAPVGAESGFRGSLTNVDLSGAASMDHMAIQAANSMHNIIIGHVRAAVGARSGAVSPRLTRRVDHAPRRHAKLRKRPENHSRRRHA